VLKGYIRGRVKGELATRGWPGRMTSCVCVMDWHVVFAEFQW